MLVSAATQRPFTVCIVDGHGPHTTVPFCAIVHFTFGSQGDASLQDTINASLVRHASEGRVVVRLKGGDPLIFGRGGEEVAHLRSEGVEVRVINGITAGLAAATELGARGGTCASATRKWRRGSGNCRRA